MRMCCLCVAWVFIASATAFAQPVAEELKGIRGVVVDPQTKKPIEGICVRARVDDKGEKPVHSDSKGRYQLPDVLPAVRLTVEYHDAEYAKYDRHEPYRSVEIQNLGGGATLHVINVVMLPLKKTAASLPESRSLIDMIRRLAETSADELPDELNNPGWMAQLVEHELDLHRDDPEAKFGDEVNKLQNALVGKQRELSFSGSSWAATSKSGIWYGQAKDVEVLGFRGHVLDPDNKIPLEFDHYHYAPISDSPQGLVFLDPRVKNSIQITHVFGNGKTSVRIPEVKSSESFKLSGSYLALASKSGRVTLYNKAEPKNPRVLDAGFTSVRSMEFSPSGKELACVTIDGTFSLWDLGDGKRLQSKRLSRTFANSIDFGPDGDTVVIGTGLPGLKGSIIHYNWGKSEEKVSESEGAVTKVRFAPDREAIISVKCDSEGKSFSSIWKYGPNSAGKLQEVKEYPGVSSIELYPLKGLIGVLTDKGDSRPIVFNSKDFIEGKAELR